MLVLPAGQPPVICGRREFLRVGGGLAIAGFLTPQWPRAAAAAAPTEVSTSGARSCILLYLLGGPPHLDMWDLKPNAPAEVRGPFSPISTNIPGIQICEHLPRLAKMADRYALVRSLSHNNNNHTPMIYYSLTGRHVANPDLDNVVEPPQRTDFPHLGAVMARFKPRPKGLPGYVAIPELAVRSSIAGEFKRARPTVRGGGGGFLGPRYDPLCVNGELGSVSAVPALAPHADVNGQRFERRAALLSVLERGGGRHAGTPTYNELREQAVLLSGSSGGGSHAFSLEAETPALRERYGRYPFGNALLLARRLAEAGVPMIAVHFNAMTLCDGWDGHSKNFDALKQELLPMLDQSLSALLDDLRAREMIDKTLVVAMGEFGRTPKINANAGRDHWGNCQSILLAGAGIKGGQVYGASDKIGAFPTVDRVSPDDLHATMYHLMGLDPEQLMHDALNRPFAISTGQVVKALI